MSLPRLSTCCKWHLDAQAQHLSSLARRGLFVWSPQAQQPPGGRLSALHAVILRCLSAGAVGQPDLHLNAGLLTPYVGPPAT
jgi:hypothetical protein